MLYTLYIHQGLPPVYREVLPGEYVSVHVSHDDSVDYLRSILWNRRLDFVATIGFDFSDLGPEVQEEVRAHTTGAVVRLDRA